MSNDLTIFDRPQLAVPDHLADFFDEEGNIDPRTTVPSLSYTGKIWAVSVGGEKTKLVKRDEEGDEIPLAVMRVFILDYNKRRGRAYYPGTYDPESVSSPECWSDDGEKPDPSISEPQCSTCAECPMAVKGSRVSDNGKAVTACSQHRMLVVVPAKKLDHPPLRLKIAVTSDYDKQNADMEAQGWFAFTQYRDWLISKGIKHTAGVVTKMRFDPDQAYPKVMFGPDRWAETEELQTLKPIIASEDVANLLKGSWTVNGVDGQHRDPDDDKPADGVAKREKELAEMSDEEKERKAAEQRKAAAAKKKAAAEAEAKKKAAAEAEAKAAAKAKQLADDDDVDLDALLGGGDDAKADATDDTKADAGGSSDIPDDISDLISEWDD